MIRYWTAGLLLGVAHLHPRLGLVAIAGVALVAHTVGRPQRLKQRVVGLLLTGFIHLATATHWLVLTVHDVAHVGWLASVAISILLWWASAMLLWAPTIGTLGLAGSARIRVWLPLAWATGEWLRDMAGGFSHGHLLHALVDVYPVLDMVGRFGHLPTLLFWVTLASAMADVAARAVWRSASAMALAGAAASCTPVARPSIEGLSGIGLVHTMSPGASGRTAQPAVLAPFVIPESVHLVIWPEVFFAQRIRAEEGPQEVTENHVERLPSAPGAQHLVGLAVRSSAGLVNAAVFVNETGRVEWVRGKRDLVPFGERPFAGLPALGETFIPGKGDPVVVVGGRRVIAVICWEAFDRELLRQGRDAGGDLIAVLSSDRPFAGSKIARRQSDAALRLAAAELHVPAVRASLAGPAMFIDARGRVVAESDPNTRGVFTLPSN